MPDGLDALRAKLQQQPDLQPSEPGFTAGTDSGRVRTAEELHAELRASRAEVNRLRALLTAALGAFTDAGHPGRPCHRTGWINDSTLARWRAAVNGAPTDG